MLGFWGQLECGARAFDVRPGPIYDSELVMHHGNVVMHKPLKTALQEIVSWLHTTPEEFVWVYVTDYEDQYRDTLRSTLASINLSMTDMTCTELVTQPVQSVIEKHALATGGSLLLFSDCIVDSYDPSIECYGYGSTLDGVSSAPSLLSHPELRGAVEDKPLTSPPKKSISTITQTTIAQGAHTTTTRTNVKEGINSDLNVSSGFYSCYGEKKDIPLEQLKRYMRRHAGIPDIGNLTMIQGHRQYSIESIAIGQYMGSSIGMDEHLSGVNQMIVGDIRSGAMPHINILEVDNVCDGGNDLRLAILALQNRTI